MGNTRLKEDEIRMLISVESTEAQRRMGDVKRELRDLTKQNRERIKTMQRMEQLGKKESAGYKNLRREYRATANEIERHNERLMLLRQRVGYVNMSYFDLQKESNRLRQALNNTSRALNPEEWDRLNKQLSKVRARMREVTVGGQSLSQSLCSTIKDSMRMQFGMQALAVSLVAFTGRVRDFIKEGVRMASVAEGVDIAFGRIADKEYLRNLRQETKGLIDDYQLMRTTVMAANFDIPIKHMADLLRFAQQRAKDTGQSVEYLVDSIVLGLGRKSALILDNLGLSAKRIQEEAKKSGDFAAGAFKIINEEMSKVGQSADTAESIAVRNAVAWKNLQLQVGGYFTSLKSGLDKMLGGVAERLSNVLSRMSRNWNVLRSILLSVTAALSLYAAKLTAVFTLHKLVILWTRLVAKAAALWRMMVLAWVSALNAFYNHATRAAAANKLLRLSFASTPWGAIISAITGVVTLIVSLTRNTMSAAKATRKMSEEIFKEQQEAKRLFAAVGNLNVGSAERARLIRQINEKYGELLGNMLSERSSADEIAEAYKRVSGALREKMAMQVRDNMLLDTGEKYAKKIAAQEADLRRSFKERWGGERAETILARIRLMAEEGKSISDMVQKLREAGLQPTLIVRKNLIELKRAMSGYKEEMAEIEASANHFLKQNTQLSKEQSTETSSLIAEQETLLELAKQMPESTEQEIKAKNKKISAINRELERLRSLGVEHEKMADSSRRAARSDVDVRKQRIQAVEKLYADELSLTEQNDKLLRNNLAERLADGFMNEEEHNSAISALDEKLAEHRLQNAMELTRALYDLQIVEGEERAEALRKANDKIIAADSEMQSIRLKQEEAASKARAEAAKKAEASDPNRMREKFGLDRASEELGLEMRLAALDAYYKTAFEKAHDNHEREAELTRVYEQAKTKIKTDAERDRLQKLSELGAVGQLAIAMRELRILKEQHDAALISEEAFEEGKLNLRLRMSSVVADAITDVMKQASDEMQRGEMDNIDRKYAAELEAAQGNYDAVRRIEDKKEAEKLSFQKKYADVNFAIKAAEIIANTAVSIMKAMAELGPIAGPVAAAVMGVTGAAQLAIANRERKRIHAMRPSNSGYGTEGTSIRVASGRESGGYLDVERAEDGRRFRALFEPRRRGYVDRPTVIVGEGRHSREWVASNDALRNPTIAPLIAELDSIQRAGRIRTVDMTSVIRARMAGLERGGFVSDTGSARTVRMMPAASVPSADHAVMARLLGVLERIDRDGVRADVLLDDFERQQQRKIQSQKLAER